MSPQVVFAVTTDGDGIYSSMARVAVASVRLSNPDYRVVLLVDQHSERLLRESGDRLFREVDECRVVDTGEGKAAWRSRFLKTSMRQTVDGPYLFLDTDVVVRGSLDEVFALDIDFAGVRNNCRDDYAEQLWRDDVPVMESMGWQASEKVYINGGVLYFADTDASQALGREWHARWRAGSEACGCHRDQPSLNSSLHDLRLRSYVLPDAYNAQFRKNAATARDGIVWHYYATCGRDDDTLYGRMVMDLVDGGELSLERVRHMLSKPHPWYSRNWLEELALRCFSRYCQSTGWHAERVRLRRLKFLRRMVRHAAGRRWSRVRGRG